MPNDPDEERDGSPKQNESGDDQNSTTLDEDSQNENDNSEPSTKQLKVTSDEVNFLIYRYLQESGEYLDARREAIACGYGYIDIHSCGSAYCAAATCMCHFDLFSSELRILMGQFCDFRFLITAHSCLLLSMD